MTDLTNYNTRIYTDIQGVQSLHYEKNPEVAKKEVAQQFEAMLMQMVMHSMRDANKAFSSGLFGSDQMDLYQDMFDKQLSLVMSHSSIGFAKIVEQSMNHMQVPHSSDEPAIVNYAQPPAAQIGSSNDSKDRAHQPDTQGTPQPNLDALAKSEKFSSPEEFVQRLWPVAKLAAGFIGANPAILLAQAALETNWGKNVLQRGQNDSTHNLFNIKADSSWADKTTTMDSLEQKNGILVKEKSSYRSYDSYTDSFLDYVNFLRQNNRYSSALKNANDSEQFVYALQEAGYATDQQYGDKIMKIYSSPSFQNLIAKAQTNDLSFSK